MNLRGSPERELHQKEHGALKRGVGSAERTTEGEGLPRLQDIYPGGGQGQGQGQGNPPGPKPTEHRPLSPVEVWEELVCWWGRHGEIRRSF